MLSLTLNKMRVIAIDPGYDRLGVAVLEKITIKVDSRSQRSVSNRTSTSEEILFSECFQTDRKDLHEKRLSDIYDFLKETTKKWKPDFLAIEKLFFTKNQKTAIAVAEARGVILCSASKLGLPVLEFGPGEIKVATTGYGKSNKKQIKKMIDIIFKIKSKKRLDDEYDAISIGLTALVSYKHYPLQNK